VHVYFYLSLQLSLSLIIYENNSMHRVRLIYAFMIIQVRPNNICLRCLFTLLLIVVVSFYTFSISLFFFFIFFATLMKKLSTCVTILRMIILRMIILRMIILRMIILIYPFKEVFVFFQTLIFIQFANIQLFNTFNLYVADKFLYSNGWLLSFPMKPCILVTCLRDEFFYKKLLIKVAFTDFVFSSYVCPIIHD